MQGQCYLEQVASQFLCTVLHCVGVRLIYWSLRSTATFVICFHWPLLLAFSLHFSSSSAFLSPSSHILPILSCGLPCFLEPSCFFVSVLFGSLSSFIRTMCPAHFIWLLTILPTIQEKTRNLLQSYRCLDRISVKLQTSTFR